MKLETPNTVSGRSLQLPIQGASRSDWIGCIKSAAGNHPCSNHPFFARLDACQPTPERVARLLRNYDAHAGVLRRLLLKAAGIMPEKACGFVLENVRNEYGNGDPDGRHELQLRDLARQAGVSDTLFGEQRVSPSVRTFIRQVVPLYFPGAGDQPKRLRRPAIAAGAITATEILAIKEFVHMQHFFDRIGLGSHIWFNHITVEAEHSDESLALALYFIQQESAAESVLHGMDGVLAANVNLYDGLMAALV